MHLSKQTTFTEQELIRALKSYDEKAYAHLYLHYRGALYNIICQRLDDAELANDVLQEVFVTVWKNIDKYDPEKGRLFTWLHTLTRNTIINTVRSKNFKLHSKNESLDNIVSIVESTNGLEQNTNQIGLRKLVHEMRDDYKNVIEFTYYNGFTQEEVAKVLNIPIGTVKTRLRNALIELRKQFA